jgi:hypothetical protein
MYNRTANMHADSTISNNGDVGMVALQRRVGSKAPLMHHPIKNLHPSMQMRLESPMHACRYLEFQNTYIILRMTK